MSKILWKIECYFAYTYPRYVVLKNRSVYVSAMQGRNKFGGWVTTSVMGEYDRLDQAMAHTCAAALGFHQLACQADKPGEVK